MRYWKLTAACLVVVSGSLAPAQGTFQNLDFEGATIQQTQAPGSVSATDAFPGWAVYYGTNQETTILYNEIGLGATRVDLIGTNGNSGYTSIEGGFSVFLQGGVSGSGPNLYATAASIRQLGLVPASAQSILFRAHPDNSGTLSILLGSVSIPYFTLSTGPDYNEYGADISAFAGQTVQLEFAVSRFPGRDYSNWNLDSIQFSDVAIPEPSAVNLSALAALFLGWQFLPTRRR